MCETSKCPLADFGERCEQYQIAHKEELESLKGDIIASALRAVRLATELPVATSQKQ